MAITSWPYVAQDTTDIEYSRLYREMAATDGVVGSFGSSDLQVYGDSSGLSVKMRSGSAILRGYMMYSTAEEIIPITGPSASTRYDRAILELNLSAPTIPERIAPKILTGTSGAGSAPALTQTDTGIFQISLATIQVDTGITSIAADKVTDERYWTDQKVGAWASNARRPANPRKYKLGYNETLGGFEYYDGASWKTLLTMSLSSSSVTGTLPVSKGGTGATTATAALNALGIYVQAAQPAYAANRVWIKTP